jgi:hypothetical protein
VIDGTDPTEIFIIQQTDHRIGLIQRFLIDENPDWEQSLAPADIPVGSASIDYLLGAEELTWKGWARSHQPLVDESWQPNPDARNSGQRQPRQPAFGASP